MFNPDLWIIHMMAFTFLGLYSVISLCWQYISHITTATIFRNSHHRYMAKILQIRRKTLSNPKKVNATIWMTQISEYYAYAS